MSRDLRYLLYFRYFRYSQILLYILLLNTQVFEILESLKNLSDHLNAYFSGGLSDDTEGASAITEAGAVGSKTTDVKALKPGGSSSKESSVSPGVDTGGQPISRVPGGALREQKESKTREDIID